MFLASEKHHLSQPVSEDSNLICSDLSNDIFSGVSSLTSVFHVLMASLTQVTVFWRH